jgi:hypothetical protein
VLRRDLSRDLDKHIGPGGIGVEMPNENACRLVRPGSHLEFLGLEKHRLWNEDRGLTGMRWPTVLRPCDKLPERRLANRQRIDDLLDRERRRRVLLQR